MVNIGDIINAGLFAAALRMATPLIFASIGGLFSERVGVVNIALEGMMLTGAFAGVLATFAIGNPWIGVLASIFAGGLLGFIHAVLTVKFAGNQIVSGTGINLLALGATGYLSQAIWGSRGASQPVQGIDAVSIPLLKDVPFLGEVIGTQTPIVYLSILTVILSYILLFKTPIGLRLRAVGEHPEAADTAGVNVYKTKYLFLILSGMLAGLGGAFLSLAHLNLFVLGMTGGRGFIALAAMILGGWNPVGALGASFLFGFADAFQMRLQSVAALPSQIILTLPYILTIVVLAVFARKRIAPSDYKPYTKE
jgi:general nucleoside transport system permease protein